MYGEVLTEGVAKLFDSKHLDIANAKVLFDFGMGTGKACVQAFFQYPHLQRVVGVEISPSRYQISVKAVER